MALDAPVERVALVEQYRAVRRVSIDMVRPLAIDDFRVQPCAEVSPVWWNLGHTTWMFARLLEQLGQQATDEDRRLAGVLNSYYIAFGPRLPQDCRGWLTRPTVEEIFAYRQSIDRRIEELIETVGERQLAETARLLRIGCEHEQQHQELFFSEIKYIWFLNPAALRPVYRNVDRAADGRALPLRFHRYAEGPTRIGNQEAAWCYDNEQPVHTAYLADFALADRLTTNAEFAEFIDDGGYRRGELWLDNGWAWVQREGWQAPLYWQRDGDSWRQWTLSGDVPLAPHEPVCHVSYYEADAFARWRGKRLPTENQWEHVARATSAVKNPATLLESGKLHPQPCPAGDSPRQMIGDLWEWTSSDYAPYPGYRPFDGPLAEYNSKFMDNQRVLRGGSCVTPENHIRVSYRNFWAPQTRFQFAGIRLAD